MPGIDDVIHGGWPVLLGFLLWSVAVYGTAHALFDGFVGKELRRRYEAWFRHRTAPIQRAAWELRTGRQWSPQAARGDPMAATAALTADERAARLARLQADSRSTLVYRGIAFALECEFCHRFWAATLWWFLIGSAAGSVPAALAGWLTNCLCYAGLTEIAVRRITTPAKNCPTCGR